MSRNWSAQAHRGLGTLLVLLAAACGGAEEPESEQALVAQVRRMAAGEVPRPVRPEVPGSFGELAEPHLVALWENRRRSDETPEEEAARRAIFEGTQPLSSLRGQWRQLLQTQRAHTEGLLAATHARGGKLPFALTLFGSFSPSPSPYEASVAFEVATYANLLAIEALESGDPLRAAALCADVFALGRDLASGPLVNQVNGAAVVAMAFKNCRPLVSRLPAQARQQLAEQLALVLSGWPPLAPALEQEGVFVQLAVYRDTLSPETREALPPSALQLVVNGASVALESAPRRALFGSWARRQSARLIRQYEAAAALDPQAGDRMIESLESSWRPVQRLAGSPEGASSWAMFFRRFRETRARLVFLQAELALRAARDRLGRLPTAWEYTGQPDPIDPRTGKPLQLTGSGTSVRVSAVPDGERTKAELEFSLQ